VFNGGLHSPNGSMFVHSYENYGYTTIPGPSVPGLTIPEPSVPGPERNEVV